MLPLYLLTNARGQQLSVELKSGEIVEGVLTNVDNWMNLTLSNVKEYRTSLLIDGSSTNQTIKEDVEILTMKEIYLKGIYIKYIKLQDNIIDNLKQQIHNNQHNRDSNNRDSNGNRNYHRGGNRYNRDSRHYGGQYQGNKKHYKSDMNRRSHNQNNNSSNNSHTNTNINGSSHQYHNQIQPNDSIPQPNINGIGGYVQYHGIDINTNNNKNINSDRTIEF